MPNQNRWSRVLVEGVVVVASILIALAVDAWWDGVQQRRIERTYIGQLTADIETLDEEVSRWLTLEERHLSSSVKILSFIDSDGAVPPRDSIGSWWMQTWTSSGVSIPDGLVQEMMASGSLRLIREDAHLGNRVVELLRARLG